MLYRLIVNAAFLAIGYYIGKEVGLGQNTAGNSGGSGTSKRGTSRSKSDQREAGDAVSKTDNKD